VHARLEVEPLRTWYYRISSNSHTLVILLQVDLASGDEPKTVYKGCYKIEDTSIFAWFSIPDVKHYRLLCNLIHQLLPNNIVDYLIRTIRCILGFLQYELFLWHSPGFNMSLKLLVKLIHKLNKCFVHYKNFVIIAALSHYLFNRYVISNKSYVCKA
jgi:hypothetical protein